MNKTKTAQHLLMVLLSLAPVAYLAAVWTSVPDVVPTHFGPTGAPNGYSTKSTLWGICLVLAGASDFTYFILQYNHLIDPKRAGKERSSAFNIIGIGIVVFLAVLNFMVIHASTTGRFSPKVLLVLLGILFAFLGNFLHHIRPNYFAGFRLPWTLANDDNWIKTHRIAGRLWFCGGLLIAACALIAPLPLLAPLALSVIGIMTLVPIVYSFMLFRKMQRTGLERGNSL